MGNIDVYSYVEIDGAKEKENGDIEQYLIRTFIPLTKIQFTYLLTVSLTALSFALIPIAVSFNIHEIAILFVGLGLFGLFQSSTWPLLIKMLNKYFILLNSDK